jgi:hypothetical protein
MLNPESDHDSRSERNLVGLNGIGNDAWHS